MEEDFENGSVIDGIGLKKLRLEIFEKENPEGVELLELEIKEKMLKVREEIEDLVETKVEEYFKKRKANEGIPSYIG